MKSMEQELLCPVCDEMVKQPIILPCQHSVCLLCAAEVLVQRGYPPPDLPPEPYSPSSTPNTRSPRQTRRPAPRTPDRLERVLRTGKGNGLCVCVWHSNEQGWCWRSMMSLSSQTVIDDLTDTSASCRTSRALWIHLMTYLSVCRARR